MLLHGLCRCCLSRNGSLSVTFQTEAHRNIYEHFLGSKIVQLDGDSDGLCQLCVYLLNKATKFRNRCLKSEQYLADLVQKSGRSDEDNIDAVETWNNVGTDTNYQLVTSKVLHVDFKADEGGSNDDYDMQDAEMQDADMQDPLSDIQSVLVVISSGEESSDSSSVRAAEKLKHSPFQEQTVEETSSVLHFISENYADRRPSNVTAENTSQLTKLVNDDHSYCIDSGLPSGIFRGRKSDRARNNPALTKKFAAREKRIKRSSKLDVSGLPSGTRRGQKSDYTGNYPASTKKLTARVKSIKRSSKLKAKGNFESRMSSIATVITRTEEQVVIEMKRVRNSAEFKEKPYKCELCLAVFTSQLLRDSHMDKSHSPGAGLYVCHICLRRFPQNCTLRRHTLQHYRLYTCVTCGKSLSDRQAARVHYERSHDTRRVPSCQICMKTFKNERLLRQHLKLHDSSKSFACDHCPKVYGFKTQLVNHMSSHTGVKLHRCPFCSKLFSSRNAMVTHSILHDDGARRQYKCDECGLCYATRSKLNEHFKIGARHLKPERLKYACDQCNARFLYASELKNHASQKHGGKTEKRFVCDICGQRYATLLTLNNHRSRSHNMDQVDVKTGKEPALRRYKCEGCLKFFYSESELDTHRLKCSDVTDCDWPVQRKTDSSTGKKPWTCPVCHKSLTTKVGLSLHLNCHSGDRPFVCELCGWRFRQPANLKRHVRVRHTALVESG